MFFQNEDVLLHLELDRGLPDAGDDGRAVVGLCVGGAELGVGFLHLLHTADDSGKSGFYNPEGLMLIREL